MLRETQSATATTEETLTRDTPFENPLKQVDAALEVVPT